MKQQANLIRAGQVIEHDGRRWTVLKQQIITPGKGGAFIQVEMRDLKTGNKTNERWRTADTVERLQTDNKDYTYSYTEGTNMVLMDPGDLRADACAARHPWRQRTVSAG